MSAATAPKAGLDTNPVHTKAQILQTIAEATNGTKFAAHEESQQASLDASCSTLLEKLHKMPPSELTRVEGVLHQHARSVLEAMEYARVCVVLDLDAFFCAVEELLDPTLTGTAFAVGGTHMLSASSYEARRYGVRSAMPGFIATKLCPHLRIIPSHYDSYLEASNKAKEVVVKYDPEYKSGGLDEFRLDLTAYCQNKGLLGGEGSSPPIPPTPSDLLAIEGIVQELRAGVKEATGGCTCSAGISPSFLVSKIASNDHKPDGQKLIPFSQGGVLAYLAPLPPRSIPGVGRVSEALLRTLGFTAIGQLLQEGRLGRLWSLGERAAKSLTERACGADGEEEEEEEGGVGRKSLSKESTFSPTGATTVAALVESLCKEVVEGLAQEGLLAHTFTLKSKSSRFKVSQHTTTLSQPTAKLEAVTHTLLSLLKRVSGEVRLVGVKASNFIVAPSGPTFLDKWFSAPPPVEEDDSDVEVVEEDVVDVTGQTSVKKKRKRGKGQQTNLRKWTKGPEGGGGGKGE